MLHATEYVIWMLIVGSELSVDEIVTFFFGRSRTLLIWSGSFLLVDHFGFAPNQFFAHFLSSMHELIASLLHWGGADPIETLDNNHLLALKFGQMITFPRKQTALTNY